VLVTIQAIHHVNVRARAEDVAKLKQFYCDVVGLRPGWRPPFASNGYWLYAQDQPVLHLVESDEVDTGKCLIDHVSFRCSDLAPVIARLKEHQIAYRITDVPVLGDTQLFFRDPLGLGVELTVIA
jgi:catechol 2,3-dioxygenase-like lactoylglutathione lyase family enzyme